MGAACNLHRGCIPFLYPESEDAADDLSVSEIGDDDQLARMVYAIKIAIANTYAKSGDRVILAHGVKSGKSSLTHFSMIKIA